MDVADALRQEHSEAPGGYLDDGKREKNLRILGEALTAKDVSEIRITRRGGKPIYFSHIKVGDVARVEDGLTAQRRLTSVSGRRARSIGISKQKGGNAVEVVRAVRREVAAITATLPKDHKLQIVFDTTVFIREAVEETEFTLIMAGILTGLVCLIFLG